MIKRSIAILTVLFAWSAVVQSARADGPYVIRDERGSWIARWIEDQGVREQDVAVGDTVTIAGVASYPAFDVELRKPADPVPASVALRRDTPLFVMADTHGEFEIAVTLLQAHNILDDDLHWSFGKGHLAILGDVFDRGEHQTELLWLIYKLEAEAQRAGGAVHFMLGNHELMVLSGDARYLNPKYQRSARALHARSYAALWNPTTLLGQWLRSKPAVMKIGNFLCMHGGLSPQAVKRKLDLETMNETLRDVLHGREAFPQPADSLASFVIGPTGPLWYRGYFADARQHGAPPQASVEDIRRIREYYKVKRILVGHTRVPSVTPLYGGDVIAVQVYPHRDPQTGAAVMEAIRIEGDRMLRARANGSVEPLKL